MRSMAGVIVNIHPDIPVIARITTVADERDTYDAGGKRGVTKLA